MKFILALLIFLPSLCLGQKQGNIWMFGEYAALDFNSGSAVPTGGSQIHGTPSGMNDFLYSEGCSSISDSAGNLLFYSNGSFAWNRLHQPLLNSSGLMGFYSSTSAAFIVPKPNCDSLFYLFTTDGLERNLANGLRYSIVDMCLDSGQGGIISSAKNVLMLNTVSEKLTAIEHPNGIDIWLVAHKHFTNAFYAYLITSSGIDTPVVTNIGSVHSGGTPNGSWSAIGQMKASSNGTKIALVFSNVSPSKAELFDFDAATGILSNFISLVTSNAEYGIEFSPDNSKLYTTSAGGIAQYNLTAGGGTQADINASKTNLTTSVCLPSGLQLGPDGKIYVGRCTNRIAVINLPNNAGIACNLNLNALTIPGAYSIVSFPSFIAGFQYNNGVPACNRFEPPCSTVTLTYDIGVTTSALKTGAVRLFVSGGTPPYLYSMDSITFRSNNTFTSLDLGTYDIYVMDSSGCISEGTFTIDEANCCGSR